MSLKQVITVSLDGKLSGLDHKSKGLDLRQFGKARTCRATLIDFCESLQMWCIHWVRVQAGQPHQWRQQFIADYLTEEQMRELRPQHVKAGSGVCYWVQYETAVAVEVAVIQAMQLSGKADELFLR